MTSVHCTPDHHPQPVPPGPQALDLACFAGMQPGHTFKNIDLVVDDRQGLGAWRFASLGHLHVFSQNVATLGNALICFGGAHNRSIAEPNPAVNW